MPHSRTYRSKVDAWLLALLVVPLALTVAIVAVMSPEHAGILLLLILACIASVAWLFRATRYVVGDGVLRVHGGLFTLDIPLSAIRSVRPSRDPSSSPALSLDRLEILYGEGKRVLVSPEDKAGFLRDIGFGDSA